MGEIIPCFFGNFLITRKIGKLLALVKNGVIKIGRNDSSVPGLQFEIKMKLHYWMELGDFHKDGLAVFQGMKGTYLDRIVSGDSGLAD